MDCNVLNQLPTKLRPRAKQKKIENPPTMHLSTTLSKWCTTYFLNCILIYISLNSFAFWQQYHFLLSFTVSWWFSGRHKNRYIFTTPIDREFTERDKGITYSDIYIKNWLSSNCGGIYLIMELHVPELTIYDSFLWDLEFNHQELEGT